MPNSGAMIDSAIGTDFQSSADDDDWKEQCVEDGETTENVNTRPRTKSGVFRYIFWIKNVKMKEILSWWMGGSYVKIRRISQNSTYCPIIRPTRWWVILYFLLKCGYNKHSSWFR